jgi:hypothetical protein
VSTSREGSETWGTPVFLKSPASRDGFRRFEGEDALGTAGGTPAHGEDYGATRIQGFALWEVQRLRVGLVWHPPSLVIVPGVNPKSWCCNQLEKTDLGRGSAVGL